MLIPISICLTYVLAALAITRVIGTSPYHWFLAALSAVFMWAYFRFARRGPAIPLVVVFTITILFPVGILLLIGLPVYGTLSATIGMILESYRKYGQLWGLEMFVPFLIALVVMLVHRRSNIAVNKGDPTASPSRRPLS